MMDTFEIKNSKAVYNDVEYDFDELPENVVFCNGIALMSRDLLQLPNMSTWIVNGNFNCWGNNLTSLKGCPKEVCGDFMCCYNILESLEGCQKKVGGGFSCSENKLKSLEHCPEKIGGDFSCTRNMLLSSLRYCPKEIDGSFLFYDTKITVINAWPEYIRHGCELIQHTNIKSINEGLMTTEWLIEFYKEGLYNSKELLMKEFGCITEEELHAYLLMMEKI